MARAYRSYRGPWILLVLLIAGGIVGNAIGKALLQLLPILDVLGVNARIGFDPVTLNLDVLSFTLGFSMAIGPFTALGMILGYLVYRRL
ncbi:MAG TPA: DUF4321 domain-containing protein [Clostridia bacterium]|nr:DUF4321 domain-containing protein [Clostridia bacterium]